MKSFTVNSLLLAGLLSIGVINCGGTSGDLDALYEAQPGGSDTSIYGTWGGALGAYDMRWVFRESQITIANKCGDTVVGVTVSGKVDENTISITESKSDSSGDCKVDAKPFTLAPCKEFSFDPCFKRSGTKLTIKADLNLELTKLAD